MKNKAIESILNRRSCRSYSKRKLRDVTLQKIVNCGMHAPSAKNKQTSSMLVITNRKTINKLRKLSINVKKSDCFYGSSTLIIVYGNKNEKFLIQDASCMMENLMIAATALNVNSCWINQVDDLLNNTLGQKLKEELNLTNDDKIVGTCALGYCEANYQFKEIVHKVGKVKYIK